MASTEAPVYVNWGRLVSDCICGDAREVELGQEQMTCVDGHPSDLAWPPDAAQILAALAERLSDKRKNWFPRNHPLALAAGLPHGQTPAELRAETAVGETADAQMLADRKAVLVAQMREFGLDVDAAGNVLGKI